ncbi:MAG: zinc-ribbon domain containing protein [Polyangia bacterium]
MSGTDEHRTCERCGDTFLHTGGEQRFYAERGLPDPPRRCAPCRKALKAERRAISLRTPKQRPVDVTPSCSWCGEPARVPFEVAAHRPVACEPCYRWRLGASSGLRMDHAT